MKKPPFFHRAPGPWLALAITVSVLAGCASTTKTVFLDETANFAAVQRVALLPLDNLTNSPHAAEKVRQILSIELLRAQAFEIVTAAEVRRVMSETKVQNVRTITSEQVRQVGDALDAQALFVGTVRQVEMDRSSGVAAPTISLQFEMLDVASGETIWSAVVSRQGAGASARLFGLGGTSTNEAIQKLIREALKTLIK